VTHNNLGTACSDRIRGERAENLKQAIACYEQALQVYTREAFPEDWATTQNNLGGASLDLARHKIGQGESVFASKNYEKAADIFEQTQNIPDLIITFGELGSLYGYIHEVERALQCVNKLVDSHIIDDYTLYFSLGNIYSSLEDHKSSITNYSRAIRLSPKEAILYRNRAMEYIQIKQWRKAEKDLAIAENLDPDDPYLALRRGDFAFWQAQFELAVSFYRQALSLREETEWYCSLGLGLLAIEDFNASRQAYQTAMERARGFILQKAIEELERARSIIPESAAVEDMVAWLKLASDEPNTQ
jgi:tetratricopeptide (TPR) repeat protein